MIRYLYILFIFISLAVITSCAVEKLEPQSPEPSDVNKGSTALLTKSTLSTSDSLHLVYLRQSSPESYMLRHINNNKGTMVLSINRDEAASFGITDELYSKYVDYVISVNEKIEQLNNETNTD